MEKNTNEKEFESLDYAIHKAWRALVSNRNSDGGWGRLGDDKSDLWNTSFVLDCVDRACEEGSLNEYTKNEIKKFIEEFANRWQDVKERIDKKSEKLEKLEKFEKYILTFYRESKRENEEDYKDLTIYALAHSACVLMKQDKKHHKELAHEIVKYIINKDVKNDYGGWGWDEFSSSNIYGTAIVANALMDYRKIISQEDTEQRSGILSREELEEALCDGFKWIIQNQNTDGGWGLQRGSDPKHTALALLALLKLISGKDSNLKEWREKEFEEVRKYIKKGFEWLYSEWPSDEKSKFFRIQSKISGRGWRVEDSRYIDMVGFEPTAYALWALIVLVDHETTENEKILNHEFNEEFTDGLLWLLCNQRENGYWHEYEDKDGRVGGDCTNYNLALGILVLSLCKKRLEEKGYISGEWVKKGLITLARLSTLRGSWFIAKPEKPLIIRKYVVSVVLSIQATFLLAALILAFTYFSQKNVPFFEDIFLGNVPPLLLIVRAVYSFVPVILLSVTILIWIICSLYKKRLIRIPKIARGFYDRIVGFYDKMVFNCKKFIIRKVEYQDNDYEILDRAILRAWEVLVLNQNSTGGWGRRFRKDKSDLWNTSFILDCLLEFYTYETIKREIREPLDFLVKRCEGFLEKVEKESTKEKPGKDEYKFYIYETVREEMKKSLDPLVKRCEELLEKVDKESTKEKPGKDEESTSYEIATNYALAHSARVLVKTGEKNRKLAQRIVKYLVNDAVKNKDKGWGWDEFSSSNIYGTAIVVSALMDYRRIISQEDTKQSSGILSREELEEALCDGFKWIIQNQNTDGGWGMDRGSTPKNTALVLLILLRLLKERNLLGEITRELSLLERYENCLTDEIEYIKEITNKLYFKPEERSRNRFKISGRGWRVEDSRYIDRVGFEPTAYALWALMELMDHEINVDQNLALTLLKDGIEWLLYTQEWNGLWHEYEEKNSRRGGVCANYYLALGILILSIYKARIPMYEEEILSKQSISLGIILKRDLALLEKLSTLRTSGLFRLSERPFIILIWWVLPIICLLVITLSYLEQQLVIFIYEYINKCIDIIILNPLLIALAGLIGIVAKFHAKISSALNKIKERVTYGKKH
jgi:hypothetical protein